ncbi:hypothetical protein TNCV_4728991 [Trichonephila clavipes]|nr:hypothetical protein TNCV_4728991 [Trichonephila clavipes]
MITELSSGIGTVLFRNCRSLQEEGNRPLITEIFEGVEPPEQPTSLANSLLVLEQFYSAIAGVYRKKEIFPHHGRAADFFGGVEPPEQPTSLAVSMHQ